HRWTGAFRGPIALADAVETGGCWVLAHRELPRIRQPSHKRVRPSNKWMVRDVARLSIRDSRFATQLLFISLPSRRALTLEAARNEWVPAAFVTNLLRESDRLACLRRSIARAKERELAASAALHPKVKGWLAAVVWRWTLTRWWIASAE